MWHDEFDAARVNPDEWEMLTKRDNYNSEMQFYVPEQISVADGKLRITATDEPLDGKRYQSGRLWTKKQWPSGRFEARIKLPTGKGMWPAFWLLPRDVPWPTGGEIDIMEARGSNPYLTSSAYHWGTGWPDHKVLSHLYRQNGEGGKPVDFHRDFHVFATEWQENYLRFFVDGDLHFTVTNRHATLHATPKAIVLNLAVGGHFDGNPDRATEFPQLLEVDYVRVWQRERKSN